MTGGPHGGLDAPSAPVDRDAEQAARARLDRLTKPRGALGRLEDVVAWLAACQGRERPAIEAPALTVFAGDHGVTARGVSAYPAEVTGQMVANFAAGGAAIAVLARHLGARLEVVDVGTRLEVHPEGVVVDRVARGSADLSRGAALDEAQVQHGLDAGRRAVDRAIAAGADLFVPGEMGIGNSTAAAALAAALLGRPAAELCGPGTGVDADGVARKVAVVDEALARHGFAGPDRAPADPRHALACVGGHELAALVGAYLTAAERGLPTLVDGFICSAAALAAVRLRADAANWLLATHASAEPGHHRVLDALDALPLLDLGLRLGEGSGAAVTVPLLRAACALHDGMATFDEAAVAEAS